MLCGCQPQGALTQQPVSGEQLYKKNCASCHGLTGRGNRMVMGQRKVDFHDPAWHQQYSNAQLMHIIQHGKGVNMPAFGDTFTEEELAHIVAYLRSLAAINKTKKAVAQPE